MAHYIRFEIYLPVVYSKKEIDPETGVEVEKTHSLDSDSVEEFIYQTRHRYQGITQANPVAPAVYKGWWQNPKRPGSPPVIDYLTYLFGLVRIDQTDQAMTFFETWKQKFEKTANQDVVLVMYYPVQTIGDFF